MTETQGTSNTARRILAGLAVLPPLAFVAASWLTWQDRLPAELASHWSDNGPADDSMATGTLIILALALTGAPAVIGMAAALRRGLRPAFLRAVLGICGVVAGMGATTWLLSAMLTMAAGSASEAVLGWWQIALIASFLYGAVPYFIAPSPRFTSNAMKGSLALGAQETAAWSRTITSKALMLAPILLLALAAAIYLPDLLAGNGATSGIGLATMLASVVVVALIVHLQVSVDWRGLRVVTAVGRIPLKRIRLDDIADIEVTVLRPSEWGGWGYRFMPGRSAIIMGAGPGLIVSTVQGKQFAVTVAEPEVAAELLLALRDRKKEQDKHDGGTRQGTTAPSV